jgi:hypothetical protein
MQLRITVPKATLSVRQGCSLVAGDTMTHAFEPTAEEEQSP